MVNKYFYFQKKVASALKTNFKANGSITYFLIIMKLGNIFSIIAIIFGVLSFGLPSFTQEVIALKVRVWSFGLYLIPDGTLFFAQFFVGGMIILAGIVLLGLSFRFVERARVLCLFAGLLIFLGTLLVVYTWGIHYFDDLSPFYGLYSAAVCMLFAFLAAIPKRKVVVS